MSERASKSQAAVGLSSGKFNEVASEGLVWGQSLTHRWPFVALCSPLTPASCLVFKMMVLRGEEGVCVCVVRVVREGRGG